MIIRHQVEHYISLKIIFDITFFLCKRFVNRLKSTNDHRWIWLFRYGNTHSETSLCAQQSTRFREEARQIIKKTVNATDDDILLFTGTGSTGAVHTLVDTFDLYDEKIRNNTVIMISAFEHHSNILPWKETGVEVFDLMKIFRLLS